MKNNYINMEDEFIDSIRGKIDESKRIGRKSVEIRFSDIINTVPDLGSKLLEHPDEIFAEFEKLAGIQVRIIDLVDSEKLDIWEIRQEFDKLIKVSGFITEASDVITIPKEVTYECPACTDNISIVRRPEEMLKKVPDLARHGCGFKGKMRKLRTSYEDVQKIVIEEDMNIVKVKDIARRKLVILCGDLTSKDVDQRVKVGQKITVNGILKLRNKSKDTDELESYLHANSIQFEKRGWETISLSDADKSRFHEYATDENIFQRLSKDLMPDIWKNDFILKALLLQLVGARNIFDTKGFLRTRGTIHVALVGSPGTGKTYMAKGMEQFSPIYRFASAASATGRGLVASVIHNKDIGSYVLSSGVIPTCNKGMCVIDELDKLNKEDYGDLNNAMNDLRVHVDKANVHGVLETDTSILATLNPEGRTFIQGVALADQITLPKDLLDRFDLIFPVHAMKSKEDQERIIQINLDKRKNDKEVKRQYPNEEMIKYIAYARSIDVHFPEKLDRYIKDKIIEFTHPAHESEHEISNRIHEVIMRLVESCARVHLRKEPNKQDVNIILNIMKYSFMELGILDSKGFLSYELMEGAKSDKATTYHEVRKLLKDSSTLKLTAKEIIEKLHLEDEEFDEIMEKLKKKGDVVEPRNGMYQYIS